MIYVLHVCMALNDGGIEKLLYEYYKRNLKYMHFDFLIVNQKKGFLEDEFLKMGSKINRLPVTNRNKYRCVIKKILSQNKYDIVHIHGLYENRLLLYCLKYGIHTRILHTHTTLESLNIRGKIKKRIAILLSTDLWACGKAAGKSTWGTKTYYVLNNAINTRSFMFSQEIRRNKRVELGLSENSLVIGNIARLTQQKNQTFLLDIFKKVYSTNSDSYLLLIGSGDLEDKLKDKAKALNIENNVIFLGVRQDVPQLLNAIDIFVLPSLFEGLPISMVEAQANGLPCVISTEVTKEMSFLKQNSFLSLSESAEHWADTILNVKQLKDGERIVANKSIIDNGFDIDLLAKTLNEQYQALIKNNKGEDHEFDIRKGNSEM